MSQCNNQLVIKWKWDNYEAVYILYKLNKNEGK